MVVVRMVMFVMVFVAMLMIVPVRMFVMVFVRNPMGMHPRMVVRLFMIVMMFMFALMRMLVFVFMRMRMLLRQRHIKIPRLDPGLIHTLIDKFILAQMQLRKFIPQKIKRHTRIHQRTQQHIPTDPCERLYIQSFHR